jgi:two-component system sensor histidine kinase BarA
VDDNEINLKLISTLMRNQGANVTEASDGQEAVNLSAKQNFDLIIMDIHMPGMKGTTAAIKIREREENTATHTPIVALTADAVPSTRVQIKEAKMDAYLLKPIDEQQMWSTIENVLDKSPLHNLKQLPHWRKNQPSDSCTPPMRDLDRALSVTGGDRKLADEMFEQLKRELPKHLAAIEAAHAKLDWASLREITHKLHGSTSSCGVPALDQVLKKFEGACRDEAEERSNQHLKDLRHEIDQLLKS